MRTSVVAAAMAASLTVGGAAGAVLFTPAVSGAQQERPDDPAGADHPLRTARLAEALAPLVDDGTITQAQADAVAAHLADQAPMRHGPRAGFRLDVADVVADVVDLDADALRDRLAAGESLADVAEAEGIDVQAVVDAIVAAHQDRLDAAVADGRLTQEEADERAADAEDHAEDLIERTIEDRDHRHRGRGHRAFGGAGGPSEGSAGS